MLAMVIICNNLKMREMTFDEAKKYFKNWNDYSNQFTEEMGMIIQKIRRDPFQCSFFNEKTEEKEEQVAQFLPPLFRNLKHPIRAETFAWIMISQDFLSEDINFAVFNFLNIQNENYCHYCAYEQYVYKIKIMKTCVKVPKEEFISFIHNPRHWCKQCLLTPLFSFVDVD